jgi:hypothetical protein
LWHMQVAVTRLQPAPDFQGDVAKELERLKNRNEWGVLEKYEDIQPGS